MILTRRDAMLSPSLSKSVRIIVSEGFSDIISSATFSRDFPEILIILLKPKALKASASFFPSTTSRESLSIFSKNSKFLGESIII